MAIPGVFAPVCIGNRVLLDGGLVDLVPYEHIMDKCDVSIAVNVNGIRMPGRSDIPKLWESVFGSFQLMQEATLAERMKRSKPDIYVNPEILDVPLLAFGHAARVLRQSAPAVKQMKNKLAEILAKA